MAETPFKRKDLLRLSRVQLIRKCKRKSVSTEGSKSDMITRLLKTETGNLSISFKRNSKTRNAKTLNRRDRSAGSLGASLKHPKPQPSLQSVTPLPKKHSKNHIDKFQLKPNKLQRLRKVKSLDPDKIKEMKRFQLYGIGGNTFGELGVNHTNPLPQLSIINKSKSITRVYSGFQYSIYTESKSKKYWSCGYNSFGECGLTNFNQWIIKPKQITHFKQENIQIKKLCCSLGGSSNFWITNIDNKVYAHGRNDSYQLGIGHRDNVNVPTCVTAFDNINIIDIQSAHSYSIALSSMDDHIKKIVRIWSCNVIPHDIVVLITKYVRSNIVYSTSRSSYGGNGQVKGDNEDNAWKEIEFFADKHIVSIRTGSEFTFFLEDNGEVWSCGDNAFGSLGLGHSDVVKEPQLVEWFEFGGIKIVDIQCGLYHVLALDEDGKCYSWGHAKRGQCGHGDDGIDDECIESPKLIRYFEENELIVKKIACGNYHSFVKTMDRKCYLFGSNHHHQCLAFDGRSKVTEPHCISDIVTAKTEKTMIKGVFLGCNNTQVIVR